MESDQHQESNSRIGNGISWLQREGFQVINLLNVGNKEDADEKINWASNQVVNAWQSNLPDAVLMVDGIENLSPTESDVFREALNKLSDSSKCLIVNGLKEVETVYQRKNTVCVCSKNQALQCFEEAVNGNDVTHTNVQYIFIPTYASIHGVVRCRTAIQNLFSEKYKLPCLKIIVGCSADVVISISNDTYFEDDIPILVVNDGSQFSKAFCAYIQSLKTSSQAIERKSFDRACKENNIQEIFIDRLTTELEENAWKITVCNLPLNHRANDLVTEMGLAICRGINPWITFIMDSSKEIAKSLTADDRYRKNCKILIFPNVAKCEVSGSIDLDIFKLYEEEYAAILSKISSNKDKVFYCIEHDGTEKSSEGAWKNIFQIAHDIMSEANIKRYSAVFPTAHIDVKKVASSCPLMGFYHALKKNDARLAECILKASALDVYPYIYFNIPKLWNDTILEKIGNGSNGRQINAVISKLSTGIFADIFDDDGRPNIKVFNPIQALLVNRLLCLQFEFVKVLWCYDKKNSLENALLIWILTNGILNDNMSLDENMSLDDNCLIKLKRYFEEVIQQLINNTKLFISFPHDNPTLSLSHVFRLSRFFDIADKMKYQAISSQLAPKKIATIEWSHKKILSESRENYDEQISLSSGIAPFAHMAIHGLFYIFVVYYSLLKNIMKSYFLQWTTFFFIISLTLDEIDQAVNDRRRVTCFIRQWWSLPWNKLNFASFLLYFVLFSFGGGGSYQSCLLFSIFSYIWCMRLCQLLRAFDISGVPILVVNTKLHRLGELRTVTFISVIGYGLVLASVLFSLLEFESWSSFIRMVTKTVLKQQSNNSTEFCAGSKNSAALDASKFSIGTESVILICICVCLIVRVILLGNYFITFSEEPECDQTQKSCLPGVKIGQQEIKINGFLEKEGQLYSFQKLKITVNPSDKRVSILLKPSASLRSRNATLKITVDERCKIVERPFN